MDAGSGSPGAQPALRRTVDPVADRVSNPVADPVSNPVIDAVVDAGLDLLLGSSCVGCGRPGRLLCRACDAALPTAGHEVRPTPCPEGLARCAAAGEYAETLRELVLGHKEHGQLAQARPLGRMLALAVEALALETLVGPPGEDATLLVPVPSRAAVVRERGHDPLLRIARVAAQRLRRDGRDVRVVRLLRPAARVVDQAGLDAAARAANLAGTMAVRTSHLVRTARRTRSAPGVSVLVVDDVLTTGATAREAQRALEAVGVPVEGIAVAAATRRRLGEAQN